MRPLPWRRRLKDCALALAMLAVLALALVLRAGLRRLARAASVALRASRRALVRVSDAVETLAERPTSVQLELQVEPVPTVPEYLQARLAAAEQKRAETAAMLADLQAKLDRGAAQLAAGAEQLAQLHAEEAAREAVERRDAQIDAAIGTWFAWRREQVRRQVFVELKGNN